jgi:hypothetical protein
LTKVDVPSFGLVRKLVLAVNVRWLGVLVALLKVLVDLGFSPSPPKTPHILSKFITKLHFDTFASWAYWFDVGMVGPLART